jgi:hypothetical protein
MSKTKDESEQQRETMLLQLHTLLQLEPTESRTVRDITTDVCGVIRETGSIIAATVAADMLCRKYYEVWADYTHLQTQLERAEHSRADAAATHNELERCVGERDAARAQARNLRDQVEQLTRARESSVVIASQITDVQVLRDALTHERPRADRVTNDLFELHRQNNSNASARSVRSSTPASAICPPPPLQMLCIPFTGDYRARNYPDFNRWLIEFELQSQTYSDDHKLILMRSLLHDQCAQQVMQMDVRIQNDYQRLTTELKAIYHPQYTPSQALDLANCRKQQHGERVDEYATDLRHLLGLARLSQERARSRRVDFSIRTQVPARALPSMEQQQHIENVRDRPWQQQRTQIGRPLTPQTSVSGARTYPVTCHTCNMPGHIARECPRTQPRTRTPTPVRAVQGTHSTSPMDECTDLESSDDCHRQQAQLHTLSTDVQPLSARVYALDTMSPPAYKSVYIEGQRASKGLLDTGAAVNIITRSALNDLTTHWSAERRAAQMRRSLITSVVAVGDVPYPVEGALVLNVHLPRGSDCKVLFHIVDQPTVRLLLGVPALNALGFILCAPDKPNVNLLARTVAAQCQSWKATTQAPVYLLRTVRILGGTVTKAKLKIGDRLMQSASTAPTYSLSNSCLDASAQSSHSFAVPPPPGHYGWTPTMHQPVYYAHPQQMSFGLPAPPPPPPTENMPRRANGARGARGQRRNRNTTAADVEQTMSSMRVTTTPSSRTVRTELQPRRARPIPPAQWERRRPRPYERAQRSTHNRTMSPIRTTRMANERSHDSMNTTRRRSRTDHVPVGSGDAMTAYLANGSPPPTTSFSDR